jgi:hypothetical protein
MLRRKPACDEESVASSTASLADEWREKANDRIVKLMEGLRVPDQCLVRLGRQALRETDIFSRLVPRISEDHLGQQGFDVLNIFMQARKTMRACDKQCDRLNEQAIDDQQLLNVEPLLISVSQRYLWAPLEVLSICDYHKLYSQMQKSGGRVNTWLKLIEDFQSQILSEVDNTQEETIYQGTRGTAKAGTASTGTVMLDVLLQKLENACTDCGEVLGEQQQLLWQLLGILQVLCQGLAQAVPAVPISRRSASSSNSSTSTGLTDEHRQARAGVYASAVVLDTPPVSTGGLLSGGFMGCISDDAEAGSEAVQTRGRRCSHEDLFTVLTNFRGLSDSDDEEGGGEEHQHQHQQHQQHQHQHQQQKEERKQRERKHEELRGDGAGGTEEPLPVAVIAPKSLDDDETDQENSFSTMLLRAQIESYMAADFENTVIQWKQQQMRRHSAQAGAGADAGAEATLGLPMDAVIRHSTDAVSGAVPVVLGDSILQVPFLRSRWEGSFEQFLQEAFPENIRICNLEELDAAAGTGAGAAMGAGENSASISSGTSIGTNIWGADLAGKITRGAQLVETRDDADATKGGVEVEVEWIDPRVVGWRPIFQRLQPTDALHELGPLIGTGPAAHGGAAELASRDAVGNNNGAQAEIVTAEVVGADMNTSAGGAGKKEDGAGAGTGMGRLLGALKAMRYYENDPVTGNDASPGGRCRANSNAKNTVTNKGPKKTRAPRSRRKSVSNALRVMRRRHQERQEPVAPVPAATGAASDEYARLSSFVEAVEQVERWLSLWSDGSRAGLLQVCDLMQEARAKCVHDKEAVEELQWAHAKLRGREQRRRRRWRRQQLLRLKERKRVPLDGGSTAAVTGVTVEPVHAAAVDLLMNKSASARGGEQRDEGRAGDTEEVGIDAYDPVGEEAGWVGSGGVSEAEGAEEDVDEEAEEAAVETLLLQGIKEATPRGALSVAGVEALLRAHRQQRQQRLYNECIATALTMRAHRIRSSLQVHSVSERVLLLLEEAQHTLVETLGGRIRRLLSRLLMRWAGHTHGGSLGRHVSLAVCHCDVLELQAESQLGRAHTMNSALDKLQHQLLPHALARSAKQTDDREAAELQEEAEAEAEAGNYDEEWSEGKSGLDSVAGASKAPRRRRSLKQRRPSASSKRAGIDSAAGQVGEVVERVRRKEEEIKAVWAMIRSLRTKRRGVVDELVEGSVKLLLPLNGFRVRHTAARSLDVPISGSDEWITEGDGSNAISSPSLGRVQWRWQQWRWQRQHPHLVVGIQYPGDQDIPGATTKSTPDMKLDPSVDLLGLDDFGDTGGNISSAMVTAASPGELQPDGQQDEQQKRQERQQERQQEQQEQQEQREEKRGKQPWECWWWDAAEMRRARLRYLLRQALELSEQVGVRENEEDDDNDNEFQEPPAVEEAIKDVIKDHTRLNPSPLPITIDGGEADEGVGVAVPSCPGLGTVFSGLGGMPLPRVGGACIGPQDVEPAEPIVPSPLVHDSSSPVLANFPTGRADERAAADDLGVGEPSIIWDPSSSEFVPAQEVGLHHTFIRGNSDGGAGGGSAVVDMSDFAPSYLFEPTSTVDLLGSRGAGSTQEPVILLETKASPLQQPNASKLLDRLSSTPTVASTAAAMSDWLLPSLPTAQAASATGAGSTGKAVTAPITDLLDLTDSANADNEASIADLLSLQPMNSGNSMMPTTMSKRTMAISAMPTAPMSNPSMQPMQPTQPSGAECGTASTATAEALLDYSTMSVKQLKTAMQQRGTSMAGVIEKTDMVQALHRQDATNAALTQSKQLLMQPTLPTQPMQPTQPTPSPPRTQREMEEIGGAAGSGACGSERRASFEDMMMGNFQNAFTEQQKGMAKLAFPEIAPAIHQKMGSTGRASDDMQQVTGMMGSNLQQHQPATMGLQQPMQLHQEMGSMQQMMGLQQPMQQQPAMMVMQSTRPCQPTAAMGMTPPSPAWATHAAPGNIQLQSPPQQATPQTPGNMQVPPAAAAAIDTAGTTNATMQHTITMMQQQLEDQRKMIALLLQQQQGLGK